MVKFKFGGVWGRCGWDFDRNEIYVQHPAKADPACIAAAAAAWSKKCDADRAKCEAMRRPVATPDVEGDAAIAWILGL